jgi:hypothetical protein
MRRGKLLTGRLLLLGNFLGQQGQQHFVPILVTFLIALALRDQLPVVRHIGVVDVMLHCSLPRGCQLHIMARNGDLK